MALVKGRRIIKAPPSLPFTSSIFFFSTVCRRSGSAGPFSLPQQTPPSPKKIPFTISAHGRNWEDSYHWMRNTSDPDLSRYLLQENSYAEAFMADTRHLQRTLFSEMTSRISSQVVTAPERWGPWFYYQHIPEGKEYPVLCRRLAVEQKDWAKALSTYVRGLGGEEVLLDWNALAQEYGFVHVGTCRVSPDHNLLAYTVDVTGSEQFMLRIKDLQSQCDLPKSRVDGVVSLAWAQDSHTLLYTVTDENQRPNRVLRRVVGSESSDVIPVFEEKDPSFCVDITSTKDNKYITVNSNSRTSSEVYIIDAAKPENDLKRIQKRLAGVQYFLEHHHGFFYILTNAPLGAERKLDCGDFYLVRCPVHNTESSGWEMVILPSEDIGLQDMDMFDGYLVLSLSKSGLPMMCSINMPIDANNKHGMEIDSLNPWYFPVPSNLCAITPGSNHDFRNSVYRMVLSSPVMPDAIVDYEMSHRVFSIVHQEEVPDASYCNIGFKNYEPIGSGPVHNKKKSQRLNGVAELKWEKLTGSYLCERKEVISHDGVSVPLTVMYSKKSWKKGQSPGILHVYGAYGEVLDKSWCADRLSLIDRGWVVAFADTRGGAGSHSSWHKSGSGFCKLNSIYDFVACSQYLVDEGYVHKDQLGAVACSAGCLIVGAALSMFPYLFRAAILKVPFLDMVNTLMDSSLPLTILDYEEFGNPLEKSHFEYISGYSPYDNIPQGVCYPSILITASFHDSRVGVWEAAKWVGKARDKTCPQCSGSIILKTNMNGGHFGEGGRYGQCEETAYEYAFLMKAMGFPEK